MTEPLRSIEGEWYSSPRHFTLSSRFLRENDCRFDATTYSQTYYEALRKIEACRYPPNRLDSMVGRVYHPTESQPRSNFKRIWVKDLTSGLPFLTGRQLFFFRPDRERFLSRRMKTISELIIPEGTILLSRSGTTGYPVLVGKWLSQFAVTDDAIRIFAGTAPIGFIYAFLSTDIGRALVVKSEYGSTVSHLEAKHVESVPVPDLPDLVKQSVHNDIFRAYALRDEANSILDDSESLMHELLGISPFTDVDVEYMGGPDDPRTFLVSCADLGSRFDASNHVPIVRSCISKLEGCVFPLERLKDGDTKAFRPNRFKRIYVADARDGDPFFQPSYVPMLRPFKHEYLSRSANRAVLKQCRLQPDQILVTRSGTAARVRLVTDELSKWIGSDDLIRVTVGEDYDAAFLVAFLSTAYSRHQILSQIYGGVVDHVNEDHVANVLVPKVPKTKQQPVARLVRRAYALRDSAEELEESAIRKVEASIL